MVKSLHLGRTARATGAVHQDGRGRMTLPPPPQSALRSVHLSTVPKNTFSDFQVEPEDRRLDDFR